jgi:hypothetical protein
LQHALHAALACNTATRCCNTASAARWQAAACMGSDGLKIISTFFAEGYCKYLLAVYTDPVKQAKETLK